MGKLTLAKTVERISERSAGVAWDAESKGLGLVLTQAGYALATRPALYPKSLPGRVVPTREDGTPMSHGHVLTPLEREKAVRAILGG